MLHIPLGFNKRTKKNYQMSVWGFDHFGILAILANFKPTLYAGRKYGVLCKFNQRFEKKKSTKTQRGVSDAQCFSSSKTRTAHHRRQLYWMMQKQTPAQN